MLYVIQSAFRLAPKYCGGGPLEIFEFDIVIIRELVKYLQHSGDLPLLFFVV